MPHQRLATMMTRSQARRPCPRRLGRGRGDGRRRRRRTRSTYAPNQPLEVNLSPGISSSTPTACCASSVTWARTFSIPITDNHSTAAARPTAPARFGEPASKRVGIGRPLRRVIFDHVHHAATYQQRLHLVQALRLCRTAHRSRPGRTSCGPEKARKSHPKA